MSARDGFNCINSSSSEATLLGQRAQHLVRAVEGRISALTSRPLTFDEVHFGTLGERLREVPVADFDSTHVEIAKHLKKYADCEVTINGERTLLSDLAIQMDSTAKFLEPYRPALQKLEGAR